VTDSKTDTTHTGSKKKIAKIVIDRPPLSDTRLLLSLGCGMAGGLIIGAILWLLMLRGEADNFPKDMVAPEQSPYAWAWVTLGMIAGFMFGWGYKRETTARLDKVDAPEPRRRRTVSTSTALARVDVSGRSRW
jgi:hypothetical protein